MSITAPIPDAARPIVEAIRAEVARPGPDNFEPGWRVEDGTELRLGEICPMGMLPNALKETPGKLSHFSECKFSEEAIKSFYEWWDAQTDAEAAVNAVWGDEKP